MMSHVGENEQPEPLDPEELARLAEFRRFQEYLRFSQQASGQPATTPARRAEEPGQELVPAPQAGPAMPGQSIDVQQQLAGLQRQLAELTASQQRVERDLNPPLWRKALRSRLVRWPIIALLLVLLAAWGVPALIQHYFGGSTASGGGSRDPGTQQGTGRFEKVPAAEVADLYANVGYDGGTAAACLTFTPAGATQFAADFGFSNCAQAVQHLHAQVTDHNAYIGQTQVPDSAVTIVGNTATVSSCAMQVVGGPRLGVLILSRNDFNEWIITGHRREPTPCPTTSASATPTG